LLATLAASYLPPERASYHAELVGFLERTQIEVPHDAGASVVPFVLWPAQVEALGAMERERLVAFLKARQLGISWLVCGFAARQCLTIPGQTWLFFSQGQDEADELIRRVQFLHDHHADRAQFPAQIKDNTGELRWANRSRILSRAATRRAGRSFTASGVVLDEFAFMQYGPQVLAAVKPVIDAGGRLFIISSADGAGTAYHRLWQAAERGESGFTPTFLPWSAHPGRDAGWRDRVQAESPDLTRADVLREYPATPAEAFTAATGLIYGDVWADLPAGDSVTEAAEYDPALSVVWAVDDGYVGKIDPILRTYTADSHPRVFLLTQERANGTVCVFAESYAVQTLEGPHIAAALALPYPAPAHAVVDKSAAALKGHLHAAGVATISRAPGVEESIKVTRGMLARDANGRRRILVHPRCQHLRAELGLYRRDVAGGIVKAFDHGPDALRYLAWTRRYEAAND
jgi:hypothetical protein